MDYGAYFCPGPASAMTSHLEKHGLELLALGYDVVPIPSGSKGCKVPNWPSVVADEKKILQWSASYAGAGIRGPRTVGIDLDIYDESFTRLMLDKIRQSLGSAPYRVGMPPKALVPFRCEEPFNKVMSSDFISSDGKKHKVEVLAKGQQFVTAHVHPDTHKPYHWHYDDGTIAETLTVPWANLPLIRESDARALVAVFESECELRGWERIGSDRRSAKRPTEEILPQCEKEYSDAEIQEILSYLNPDMPYNDWLRVGMALHHGGYSVNLWDEWSKRSNKYRPDECSYTPGGRSGIVKILSVMRENFIMYVMTGYSNFTDEISSDEIVLKIKICYAFVLPLSSIRHVNVL